MTNRPKKIGGRREPPGGRPPKGNVKFYCYLQPGIMETIDEERGALSRGEFITLLIGDYKVNKSKMTRNIAQHDDLRTPEEGG